MVYWSSTWVFAMRIKVFSKLLHSKEMLGISFMLASCFFYALMNCFSKLVTHSVDPMTMVFYRNLFALITIAPFAYYNNKQLISRNSFTRVNLARGVGGFLSMTLWFLAIAELPVTEVIAVSFLTPILVSLLAVFFLKEQMTIEKAFALFTGLIGVYIVLRPQGTGVNIATGYILAACFIWASTSIMIKQLTKTQDSFTIVFYMALIIVPMTLPWAVYNPYTPTIGEAFYLLLIAISSNAAQVFMAKAYKVTRVTVVMPFDFTRLIFTSFIAYSMFGEIMSKSTMIGGVIIAIAGYVVASKEFKKKNQVEAS
jgi:drug/metabolite transporter (DMT)-like permease